MNTKLKTVTIVSTFAIAAVMGGLSLFPRQSQAAGFGGAEQYKVLNATGADAAPIEQQLNALASEGWKVRAATAQGFIILVK